MARADVANLFHSFFEASANVSLSGYEEAALEDDVTHTNTNDTTAETPTDHDHTTSTASLHDGEEEEDEDFGVDSPTQITGAQSTPRLPPSTSRRTNGKAPAASYRSPSPRKYTGRNPLAMNVSAETPSTPRPQANLYPQSSPFEPESAYQPSGARQQNPDPLMHRGVLDKNYRIQATPHAQRRQQHPPTPTTTTAAAKTTPTTATKRAIWDSSPDSSPDIAAPQLRSDLFSPAKPLPRTPGISVLTPARNGNSRAPAPTTSTSRQLFSLEDKAYATTRSRHTFTGPHHDDSSDDDDDDDLLDMSPPKTMQFHVPQSRLLQTPAREASRRIVEDLLLTAGAADEIDGEGAEGEGGLEEEPSPSVVRRAFDVDDDTF